MITVPTKRKPRPIFKAGLRDTYQHVPVDSTLMLLEKAEPVVETFGGMTSMDKITDALDEFSRLFKAGVAQPAAFRMSPSSKLGLLLLIKPQTEVLRPSLSLLIILIYF